MARIRSIKPEFPQSESMGRVSRDARLTFILLWTLADDSGRLRGNSRMLASLLFPYDNDAPKQINNWLKELKEESCVDIYAIDGNTYIQIRNWLQHQKIDKPTPSKIPPLANPRESSANPRESSPLDQGRDQGRDQGEEGSGSETRLTPRRSFVPPTIDEVSEFCRNRNNGIDAAHFVAFYESKGWMIGKNKMTDWRKAIVTWECRKQDGKHAVAVEGIADYDAK